MVEAVRSIEPQQIAAPQVAGPPEPANDVAGWWNAEPVTPAPVVQAAAANDVSLTDRAQTNVLLAEDVYRAEPTPPAGYRVASAEDLDKLGITPEMLEQPGSSFRARVYATGEGDATQYVVAFRGSSSGEDWKNNVQQALGLNSESYAKALEIGRQVARSDEAVTFTGHSLGGGLASAAGSPRRRRSPAGARRIRSMPRAFRATRSIRRAASPAPTAVASRRSRPITSRARRCTCSRMVATARSAS